MPEPTERFEFAKTKTRTQIEVLDGKPFCFIDVGFHPSMHDTCPDVTIGWAPDGSRFGLFANGHQVWPPDSDTSDDVVDDTIGEDHASD